MPTSIINTHVIWNLVKRMQEEADLTTHNHSIETFALLGEERLISPIAAIYNALWHVTAESLPPWIIQRVWMWEREKYRLHT